MFHWTLVFVTLAALFGPVFPTAPQVNAVVGSGTAASCTEAAFNTALATIQASASGTLTFNCGGAATIVFSAPKTITQTVGLDGAGLITLDGANTTRLFNVAAGGNLAVGSITLTRGYSSLDGGAISVAAGGILLLDQAVIRGSNTGSAVSGGAIVSYGTVIIVDSLLENNTGGNGGALYLRFEAADASITNTTFRNNRTTAPNGGWGGAILLWDGADLTLNNVILDGNQAGSGGAIDNRFATSVITAGQGTVFMNNTATNANGGAVYNYQGSATFTNVTFTGNVAGANGGGVDTGGNGSISFSNAIFENNSAPYGGGISNTGPGLSLYDVSLSGNRADFFGGGILNTENVLLTNVTLVGNSAQVGGGLDTAGTATLRNVTFSGNTGTQEAGGLNNLLGSSNLTNVTFHNNFSPSGSSLRLFTGTISLKNTILSTGLGANCAGSGDYTLAILSAGFNLSSDSSCGLNQAGDQVNTPPNLGPLAYYGGFTPTHLPRLGSPAINNGTGIGATSTDQRGLPRPSGGVVDIGAVERQPGDQDLLELLLPVIFR